MKKLKLILFALLLCPNFLLAQTTSLVIQDSRDVPTVPEDYISEMKAAFKRGTSIGFTETTYFALLGMRGWRDDSGGPGHELAFSPAKGIFYRTGTKTSGWTGWRRVLAENTLGNVGIGTDAPQEKLSVKGNIRAQQVKVEMTNWPDFVFDDSYQLPSLKETEAFIKENKHLPGVPKAEEIEADGLSLGEMNKILMQKVEELTLHLINKEKEISKLKETNTDQYTEFSKRLSEIEEVLKKCNN